MKDIKAFAILMTVMLLGFISVGVTGFYTFKESLIEAKKQEIELLLNIARQQSAIYIEQYHQGLLSKAETDQKIIKFLSGMRYGASYLWANDNNAIARVHIRERVIGQIQKSYVRHMENLVHEDILYVVETNIKPSNNTRTWKINGVTEIPEWKWVIGMGIYLDDVDNTLFTYISKFLISIVISMVVIIMTFIYSIRRSRAKF
ncbi:cache domain-containing protein [Agarivorans sp. Z349TD_8]|uniref:cache domain-containing protein n=1 Tax=Agarivorans sp. Z349TD_8 TaxID=3421434 RepID=UPI003D7E6492